MKIVRNDFVSNNLLFNALLVQPADKRWIVEKRWKREVDFWQLKFYLFPPFRQRQRIHSLLEV